MCRFFIKIFKPLLMSVHKACVWFRMLEFEACKIFKIKEFTFVNDCFQYKSNEEIDVFWRALINKNTFNSVINTLRFLFLSPQIQFNC